MSNFINTRDGDLLYSYNSKWYSWSDAPNNDGNSDTTNDKTFKIVTKDFTFGESGVLKKIHKIYVSYKMNTSNSKILIKGAKNGSQNFSDISFSNVENYHDTNGFLNSSNSWATAIVKPSSSLSCYSLQLQIETSDESVAGLETFNINDISIVYRQKTIK